MQAQQRSVFPAPLSARPSLSPNPVRASAKIVVTTRNKRTFEDKKFKRPALYLVLCCSMSLTSDLIYLVARQPPLGLFGAACVRPLVPGGILPRCSALGNTATRCVILGRGATYCLVLYLTVTHQQHSPRQRTFPALGSLSSILRKPSAQDFSRRRSKTHFDRSAHTWHNLAGKW